MIKKIFFIILSLNLLNHCDYKPVYSNQDKVNYRIIIDSLSGDKDINNFIITNIKRNSQENSKKIVNIVLDTKYTKKVLAKNSAGSITDFQSDVQSTFIIKKGNSSENFSVKEKFNFKKMVDKYEEKSYERTIKKNLANSISQKIILRLAVIK